MRTISSRYTRIYKDNNTINIDLIDYDYEPYGTSFVAHVWHRIGEFTKLIKGINMREKWIDLLKAIAIVAVLIDHTNGTLYCRQSIWYLSWFAVPLFSTIAGYNCYTSAERHTEENIWNYLFRSLKVLLTSYAICLFIYEISSNHFFDLYDYARLLITFKGSGHFYYVFMHAQLVIVGFFAFRVLRNLDKQFDELIFIIVILLFSILSMKYTNVLDLFGGGGKLFGGVYFFMFIMGGIAAKHNVIEKLSPKNITPIKFLMTIVLTILPFYMWWRIMNKYCENIETWGRKLGLSYPGIELCGNIMGIFAFLGFGVLFKVIEYNALVAKISTVGTVIGKHSMPIFLYHILIIRYLNSLPLSNTAIKRVTYFIAVIVISILIDKMLALLKQCYNGICVGK